MLRLAPGWLLLGVLFIATPMRALAELDPASGLIVDTGFEQVRAQCAACHSLKLVQQNRADRDGWLQMIRWMQETQGLWALGDNEPLIVDYLAKHYGPVHSGRRKPLPRE
jgi:hypothetical protein